MAFLAENNVCGQTLLKLVARGSSIIAEMTRLHTAVPSIFRMERKEIQQQYGEVLLDFGFFQNPSAFNDTIEKSKVLQDLDNAVRERHMPVLSRLYATFESIYRYAAQLKSYLQELSDGSFLHSNMDLVFADHDGKQLMCEALYLYGVQLLLVDKLYPGCIRERLIVAHHRHSGMDHRPSGDTNVDDVCRLLRSTGLNIGDKRPQGYPENYFRRVELPGNYIDEVLGHLRTDDIYNQISVYPSPDHRTTAFSSQAAMLYVCLYFSPTTLLTHQHRMREIVDRFFSDNWVVSYFMGITTNLIEAWDPYKAAKEALTYSIETNNVKRVATNMGERLRSYTSQCTQLESEGALSEAKVLSSSDSLLRLVRDCNVTLRWLVLHCAHLDRAGGVTMKRATTVRELVVTSVQYTPEVLFDLLLHSAGLELKLAIIYKNILQEKAERVKEQQDIAVRRLQELSEAFDAAAPSRPLTRVRPNSRLQKWFSATAEQLSALDIDDPQATARKLLQMVFALNQVKEYHDLSSSGGATQAVEESIAALQQMERLCSAGDCHMAVLTTVTDLSYAWRLVDQYTPVMQRRIKEEPGEVVHLRSVFLKLSSGLELPLLRIMQARSQDVLSVSAFYSGQLVHFIKKVLQIIPETMFRLLENIVELQTKHLTDLPTRLDKDKMRDLAQLPQRYKLSELCHSVGVLAAGVEQMGDTLVGVVELQPLQLLEDGVRNELLRRVASIMHNNLVFPFKKGSGSCLLEKLDIVSRLLRGFRLSFEYIQDYIGLYALKIWHEELTRLISQSLEQDCEMLLPGVVMTQTAGNGATLPLGEGQTTFAGRIVAEIVRITDPKVATYVVVRGAWFDNTKYHTEVADGSSLFAKVQDAVTVAGLAAVEKVLACHTVVSIKEVLSGVHRACGGDSATQQLLSAVIDSTTPHTSLINDPERQYSLWSGRASPSISPALLRAVQKIGQLQLLRLHASSRLNSSTQFEAAHLHEALHTLNLSLLEDMRQYHNCSDDPNKTGVDPDPSNALSSQLSGLLEWAGLTQPLQKVYCPVPQQVAKVLPHFLFLLVLILLPKLRTQPKIGAISGVKPSDGIDGSVVCVGLVTLLRQLPPPATVAFTSLLAQYIASMIQHLSKGSEAVSGEVQTCTAMLHFMARLLQIPPSQLSALLPAQLTTAAA